MRLAFPDRSLSAPWRPRAVASAALAAAVFALLDVVDVLLCFVYAFLDGLFEDTPATCYCHRTHAGDNDDDDDEEISDTLYVRRSAVRDALTWLVRAVLLRRRTASPPEKKQRRRKGESPRWSDCGCASCRSTVVTDDDGRLHFVVSEPNANGTDVHRSAESGRRATQSSDAAIFIHGFTSSSLFWTKTFRESSILDCRLLAVDLLGFGKSPKPADCMYRLRDHVETIERTLLAAADDDSSSFPFHLVGHSMGCVIAIALAAKHPARVRSITLVAPPYFLPCEEKASQVALRRLAGKKLWPPLQFGSAVMSWYEHIGRTVCFLVCKHHLLWEWLLKLLIRNRDVEFLVGNLTKHTHHSAWHTMHNVICAGAALQEGNLDAVEAAGIPVRVIHGGDDQVVPVECGRQLKKRLPRAELRVVGGCDHKTVIMGREKSFAEELRAFWSDSDQKQTLQCQGVQINGW